MSGHRRPSRGCTSISELRARTTRSCATRADGLPVATVMWLPASLRRRRRLQLVPGRRPHERHRREPLRPSHAASRTRHGPKWRLIELVPSLSGATPWSQQPVIPLAGQILPPGRSLATQQAPRTARDFAAGLATSLRCAGSRACPVVFGRTAARTRQPNQGPLHRLAPAGVTRGFARRRPHVGVHRLSSLGGPQIGPGRPGAFT